MYKMRKEAPKFKVGQKVRVVKLHPSDTLISGIEFMYARQEAYVIDDIIAAPCFKQTAYIVNDFVLFEDQLEAIEPAPAAGPQAPRFKVGQLVQIIQLREDDLCCPDIVKMYRREELHTIEKLDDTTGSGQMYQVMDYYFFEDQLKAVEVLPAPASKSLYVFVNNAGFLHQDEEAPSGWSITSLPYRAHAFADRKAAEDLLANIGWVGTYRFFTDAG